MQFCLARVDQLQRQIEQEKGTLTASTMKPRLWLALRAAMELRRRCARYRELHCSVIDSLLTQIANRFSDHKKLEFLALLDRNSSGITVTISQLLP
ncbi:hypothetical protein F7725_001595 [Dissostichus mawsoni]|uniref:Uncharacterized protein n=1 Tax=Dissostichus mawsoni TaxID=36200 RepID=A0A7J5Y040_DISMA|nr:hypothetical protein F7725_001595 [Dissostichus mawsoni]